MIGLSIHLEKGIWIDNHIFVMDLDLIVNPENRTEQQPVDTAQSDETALKMFLHVSTFVYKW